MKFYRRPGIAWAALAGLLCGLATPAVADDPAGHLPADTLAYVGWDRMLDDSNAGILQAVPAMMRLFEADASEIARIEQVLPLLEAAGRADGALALLGLDWDRGPMPVFAFVSHGPGQQIMDAVDRMHGDVSGESIGGVTLKRHDEFAWGLYRDTFFFCSDSASQRVIDVLVDREKSLAKSAAYRAMRDRARAAANPDWQGALYVQVHDLLDTLKRVSDEADDPAPPEFWQALGELGVMQMNGTLVQAAPEDEYMVTRAFIGYEGEPRGLLKLWQQKNLTAADLNRVPADAYWASACNLDLEQVRDEIMRVIDAIEPDMISDIEGGDAMAASMLGFSPLQDLVPIFGDTWIFYDAPAAGGWWFTGATMLAEAKDPEGLRAIFARLMQIATPVVAAQDMRMVIRSREHQGHTIEYLTMPGLPVPFAPAVAYHDGFAVCGLSPQAVQVALDHLAAPDSKGGLASHADVEAIQAKFGGPVQGLYYTDQRYFSKMAFGLTHLIHTAAASLTDGDPGVLPTLAQSLDGVGSTVGSCRQVAGGVLYESYSTGGSPLAVSGSAAAVGMGLSVLLPSLSRARSQAKRVVSMSNMRGIGQACHIYANDNDGQFPEDFETLIESGMITAEMLNAPNDPMDDISYVMVTGQTFESDARNVLAYQKAFNPDGTNVLFLDGHVEFVDWDRFPVLLRETYERLERPEDMPVEFR